FVQVKGDVALEVDREAVIIARREGHGSATGRGGGLDGLVDGGCVDSLAVGFGAEGFHVEGGGSCQGAAGEAQAGAQWEGSARFHSEIGAIGITITDRQARARSVTGMTNFSAVRVREKLATFTSFRPAARPAAITSVSRISGTPFG